jgi:undecaprenyl-diphosphatase
VLSNLQAVILGVLQGVSELFPVSSLGHSILLPALLGWTIDQNANYFLTFLIATHFATAAVLFFIYRRDWRRIISGILRSIRLRSIASDSDAKLGWLLVVGTVPAGIVGIMFQKQVQKIFAAPVYVASFLALNGVLLYAAELMRTRSEGGAGGRDADDRIAMEISWRQSAGVGLMQALALLPGFSRTGATIAGGLMVGLAHEDALRFSFLLATPIIAAAAALKLPMLLASRNAPAIEAAMVGAGCAALASYLSVKFLTSYFRTRTLTPFAVYCVLAGSVSIVLLLAR